WFRSTSRCYSSYLTSNVTSNQNLPPFREEDHAMAMKPPKSTEKSHAPSILMTSHQASRIGTPIPINSISGSSIFTPFNHTPQHRLLGSSPQHRLNRWLFKLCTARKKYVMVTIYDPWKHETLFFIQKNSCGIGPVDKSPAFMSQNLSQRGVVVDMSFKHRSTNQPEHRRIKDLRGYFEDGCLNGVLAVTSAIENWELKSPFTGSSSPLISDPKIQQTILTEEDDFLVSA
ncbi:hypothetical protein HID58_023554, partial [Brassica napus]